MLESELLCTFLTLFVACRCGQYSASWLVLTPHDLSLSLEYLLTNWLAYLYGRIQSPRPDVMPDRREGITRAAGFVFACIDTQAS